jgi:uncharacterized protein (TIRG00374 family)
MLVFGLGLLGYLLWRADLGRIWSTLRESSPGLVALGICADLLTPFFRAERFGRQFRIFRKRLELTGQMMFFGLMSMIFPARSGDLVLLLMLKKVKLISTVTEAAPKWILLRVFDAMSVAGLVLVVAPFFTVTPAVAPWFRIAGIFLIGVIAVFGVGFFLWNRVPAEFWNERFKSGISDRLSDLREGFRGIKDWRVLTVVLLWTLAIWLWSVCILVAFYIALGVSLAFYQIVCVSVAVLAFSVLPINAPGGIGTFEGVQILLLCAFGVPESEALAVAVGIHCFVLLTVGIQGFLGTVIGHLSPKTREGCSLSAEVGSLR